MRKSNESATNVMKVVDDMEAEIIIFLIDPIHFMNLCFKLLQVHSMECIRSVLLSMKSLES